jgi:hypothetical protein
MDALYHRAAGGFDYELGISPRADTKTDLGMRITRSLWPHPIPWESCPFIDSVTSSPMMTKSPSTVSAIAGQLSRALQEFAACD